VSVDPPPEELAYDTSEKVKRLRVKLGSGYNHNIIQPTSFSPYLAVPSSRGYDVYDMRTGSIRARTKVGFDHFAKSALSPGAKYFATTVGTFGKGGFGIYDIKEKKDLGSVQIEDVQDIMFASDEKILILTENELSLYETSTGVKLDALSLSRDRDSKTTLSPGGRYLANFSIPFGLDSQVTVAVYDLEQMTIAGDIRVPKGGGPIAKARGIAFSPDGEQLAALITDHDKARMLIWDVASGQKLDDFEIKEEFDRLQEAGRSSAWYGKNDLAWFPDKNRLLMMDYGIVDRHVGELVFILPAQNGSSSFRWPASATQLVGITGSSRSPSLESVDLPVETFDQAREAIEKGGLAIDAVLPPITNIKTNNVVSPQSRGTGWSVTADPAPRPMEKLIPKTLEFKLPKNEGYFSQFFLSDAAAGKAVIARKTSANRWRHHGEPIVFQAWLDIYDLSRGKQLGELELPYPCDAIAFSPSGKHVVTRDAEYQERLDIWNPDSQQHVLGFRPHVDLRETSGGDKGLSDYGEWIRTDISVKAARFLDDEHMVTLSGEDRLRGWKLPECSLIYEIDDIGVPGISPGGKLLAAHENDRVMIHDAHTGEILGQLTAPGKMTSAAFHPNGRLLAVTVSREADYFLFLWDIETGKQMTSFPLPMPANQIRFAHENYVLINDKNLVDLQRQAVAWNYHFPQPCFLPFGIDDRILFCGPLPDRRPILYLTAVNLPSDALREKIENSSLSAEFIPLEGKSFSLSSSIQGDKDLQKTAVSNFKGRLESMGCAVKPNGRFGLALRTEEKEGRTATYVKTTDPFSGGLLGPSLFDEPDESSTQTANIRNVECSLTIYDSRQQVWRTASTYSNYSFGVTIREGSSLQGELDKNLTRRITSFFSNSPLPTFVFPPGAEAGLGRSQLDQYGTISD
jgi:WD40 repeat protein